MLLFSGLARLYGSFGLAPPDRNLAAVSFPFPKASVLVHAAAGFKKTFF
jgi:hypothetical protein